MEAKTLKKRHLGIAGLILALTQYGASVHSERSTKESVSEIMRATLLLQRADIERGLERDFVRRDMLAVTVNELTSKLDTMNVKVDRLTSKAAWIEGYLRKTSGVEVSDRRPTFKFQSAKQSRWDKGES